MAVSFCSSFRHPERGRAEPSAPESKDLRFSRDEFPSCGPSDCHPQRSAAQRSRGTCCCHPECQAGKRGGRRRRRGGRAPRSSPFG